MRFLSLLFFFSYVIQLSAQDALETELSIDLIDQEIEEALLNVSEKANINIFFSPKLFPQTKRVTVRAKKQPIKVILKQCLEGTRVGFKFTDGSILLFKKKPLKYSLSGYLSDALTGDRLIGGHIFDLKNNIGCTSNDYGFYSKNFASGKLTLYISYLGYQSKTVEIDLSKNQKLDITLDPAITLEEIIVKPNRDSTLLSDEISQTVLPLNWLAQLPTIGGESDVIRYLHLLPGIQSGADGFGGLHVRGGNSDHNLILLDDVPVYNPSHTFGFYSIFNPDLNKSVKFYKSGFPSRYDSRISSVLDIRTREANTEKLSGSVSLGTTATRGLIEIPLKGRGGILIAGRRSHINLWLKPYSERSKSKFDQEGQMSHDFFDFNLKAHYTLNRKNKLYFSQYFGRDNFLDFEESDEGILDDSPDVIENESFFAYQTDWGNNISSIRWNHLFTDKLFANTTLTYSKFDFYNNTFFESQSSVFDEEIFAISQNSYFSSLIEDFAISSDFDYFHNNQHHFKFGVKVNKRNFQPGFAESEFEAVDLDSINQSTIDIRENEIVETLNADLYLEDEFTFKNWTFNVGLRNSFYNSDNIFRVVPQPRLHINYKKHNFQVTANATYTTQFLNVLTNSDAGLPTDVWVPNADKIAPQNAWQYSLGVSGKLPGGQNWKIDTYYKSMNNLLRIKDSISFTDETDPFLSEVIIDGNNWESIVDIGSGQSFGFEAKLEQQYGKLTGWVSYSLINTKRTFNEIQRPYRFDNRHSVTLAATYRINDWLNCSANFIFQSGRPIVADNFRARDIPFSNLLRNRAISTSNNRLPAYHRLDLGINAHFDSKYIKHEINFSLYNAYNRKNFLFTFNAGQLTGQSNTILGLYSLPVIPALNYTISW